MLKNYFIIAVRNLLRNRIYSVINIAGLSIGLSCAMLILLYVKDEASFDKFHKNVNNIYHIVRQGKDKGREWKDGNTGFLQGPRFTQNVAGIKSFVRVQYGREDIKKGTDVQSQELLRVDSSFFSVFTFPLIYGNPVTCLTEPHSIVLSEDVAKRQFGTTNAVGKLVMIKQDTLFVPYKVTAVTKRCPQNSTVQFDALLPFKESEADAANTVNWFNTFLNTFVVLDNKADKQTVEKRMQNFYVSDAKQVFEVEAKKWDMGADASMDTYFLQPYLDMHLSTELSAQNGLKNASNPMYSYILSGIALFVLLIACINFINLTVARSVKRAKEIGMRKVVGGSRKQLIIQFLGESFLLCFLSFALAVWLVQLLLPLFNNLANKALALSYLFDAKLIAAYVSLFVVTALLAGFYPALVLSGFNPVKTLYGKFSIGGKNYLQKSLVVLQFALASFLIIATFIIYSQFNFLTKTDLGYDDTHLVTVDKFTPKHEEAAIFKNELMKNPDIVGVSAKNGGYWGTSAKTATDSTISFAWETVDEAFLPLLKIPMVAGRNFSKDFPADSALSVIVNESFVKAANWKNPVGETVNFWYNNKIYHVIGVVKDYHFRSLNEKIGPQLFTMKKDNAYGMYFVKIKPKSETASLQWIQKTFKQLYPMSPYTYEFKDAQNIKEYESVAKWKQILLFGAILTIFISCIGMFGLSVLSAEKRTKEIGIRKILGASVKDIVTTLSIDFIKLVVIALAIAIPAGYIVADKWLQNFPYRITVSWLLFASAALMVLLIALVTVSFQSIKAAMANPAKSIKTE